MPCKDKQKFAEYMRSYNKRPHVLAKASAYHTRIKRIAKLRLVGHMGGKCMDCGLAVHVAAFHFDHRDRKSKVVDVGAILNRSWARILAEAAKCDLVCANCHAIRTWPDAAVVA